MCGNVYLTGCIFKKTHLSNLRSENINVAKCEDYFGWFVVFNATVNNIY